MLITGWRKGFSDEHEGEWIERYGWAEADLEKARRVIAIQGNVSALLEQMLGPERAQGSTER